MIKRNPYEPLSKEEQLKIDKEKKGIAERIETTAKLAAECLADPKFNKYREEFEQLRDNVLKSLAQPIDSDPIKDAYYLRACMNTILVLDKLIGSIKKDTKKG